MPLEPGQAVRLMPWAVPRLDTSWLIAANHDVAAPGSPGTAGQPHGAQPMLTRSGPPALICPPAHSPVGRETPPGWCLVDSRGFVGLRPVPPAALQARQRRVDPVSCPCKYLRRSTSTSPATVRPSTDIPFGAAGTSTWPAAPTRRLRPRRREGGTAAGVHPALAALLLRLHHPGQGYPDHRGLPLARPQEHRGHPPDLRPPRPHLLGPRPGRPRRRPPSRPAPATLRKPVLNPCWHSAVRQAIYLRKLPQRPRSSRT